MTQETHTPGRLGFKDGAFWRGDARLVVMTRGRYGDGAPSHKEVSDAEQEIVAAVHSAPSLLSALRRAEALLHELRAHDLDDAESRATMAEIAAALAEAAPIG